MKKRKRKTFFVEDLELIVRKIRETLDYGKREWYVVHVFQQKDGVRRRLGSLRDVSPPPSLSSPKRAAIEALAFAYQPNWYEWDGTLAHYKEGDDYPYQHWTPSEKRLFRLHESYDWETLPQDKNGEFKV